MLSIEPTWDVYTEFIKRINMALELDAKRSSHPVQLYAESPAEIGQASYNHSARFLMISEHSQAFDQLSYSKAASGW